MSCTQYRATAAPGGRPWRFQVRALRSLAALVLVAVLAACSINPRLELAALDVEPVRLHGIPFHPQTEFQCGPASLAGLLGASGIDADPDALAPQVYLPGREGSLQVELLGATRRAGRIPYVIDRTPDAIAAELAAGRPVLVMQNLRTPRFPVWHYAVVTGVDPGGNRFVLNSGTEEAVEVHAPTFLRTWDWAQRWAFVVLAPGELPASAEPLRYAEAVADFERVAGGEASEVAWRAALLRWPEDHRPRLALGNLAYADGRKVEAASLYHEGLKARPDDPVLSNNLATVLGELGCPEAAHAVIGPALASLQEDSPWHESLRATAAGLDAAPASAQVDCSLYATR